MPRSFGLKPLRLLYPFEPDLLIFHVYEFHVEYENIWQLAAATQTEVFSIAAPGDTK
jgi:hypothetical protein